jgi:hypothetical protein
MKSSFHRCGADADRSIVCAFLKTKMHIAGKLDFNNLNSSSL